MRTNKNFILRGIADEYMLVPINEAAQEFNGILHLTETASFIWKMVDQCETITDIVKKVIEEYEVDEDYEMELLPKQQIAIVVETEKVDEIVELVKQELYTGHIGDGKIFVYKIDNVIRVRTGDEGVDAL